jgi:hypothetical protein
MRTYLIGTLVVIAASMVGLAIDDFSKRSTSCAVIDAHPELADLRVGQAPSTEARLALARGRLEHSLPDRERSVSSEESLLSVPVGNLFVRRLSFVHTDDVLTISRDRQGRVISVDCRRVSTGP